MKIGFEVEATRTVTYEADREDLIDILQEDLDYEGEIPEDDKELVKLFIEEGGTPYIESADIDLNADEKLISVYEA